MINLCTKYKSNGEWYKQGDDQNKVMVALATYLKQERSKNKNIPSNLTRSTTKTTATEPGNSTGPSAWKFKNVGEITTCPNTVAKYK